MSPGQGEVSEETRKVDSLVVFLTRGSPTRMSQTDVKTTHVHETKRRCASVWEGGVHQEMLHQYVEQSRRFQNHDACVSASLCETDCRYVYECRRVRVWEKTEVRLRVPQVR